MDIHEALEYARTWWTNPDDHINDRQVGMVLTSHVARLESKLNDVHGYLKSLHAFLDTQPQDCFGEVPESYECPGWFVRDEEMWRITKYINMTKTDDVTNRKEGE